MQHYEMRSIVGAIQARYGLKSQPAVSRFLGITEKTLSNWIHGRNYPDGRMCRLLAEHSGVDPDILAAYVESLRAPTPEQRETWQRVVRRLLQTGEHATFSGSVAMQLIAGKAAVAQHWSAHLT